MKPPALEALIDWIVRGHGEKDLRDALATYYPGESPEVLIEQAATHFTHAGKADRTMVRGFCIEAYRTVYQKAFDIGDYTTALRALKQLENTAKS